MVEAATHPTAAILVDCLQFDRSDSSLDEIPAIARALMNYIQICDGPLPCDPDGVAVMALGRTARLVPRDGGIDLAAILTRPPQGVPIPVEFPNNDLESEIGVGPLVAWSPGRLVARQDKGTVGARLIFHEKIDSSVFQLAPQHKP